MNRRYDGSRAVATAADRIGMPARRRSARPARHQAKVNDLVQIATDQPGTDGVSVCTNTLAVGSHRLRSCGPRRTHATHLRCG